MRLYNSLFIAISVMIFASCTPHTDEQTSTTKTDSTEIAALLKNTYKWHDARKVEPAFKITGDDSLETGIDTTQLMHTVDELQKTKFFTTNFLHNYKHLGFMTDSVLKHGKYYHEINFGFQDADPWTFFQDDAPNYWDSLIIKNLIAHPDSASLKWTIKRSTINYLVRLTREGGTWKIDYLQGFDLTNY